MKYLNVSITYKIKHLCILEKNIYIYVLYPQFDVFTISSGGRST